MVRTLSRPRRRASARYRTRHRPPRSVSARSDHASGERLRDRFGHKGVVSSPAADAPAPDEKEERDRVHSSHLPCARSSREWLNKTGPIGSGLAPRRSGYCASWTRRSNGSLSRSSGRRAGASCRGCRTRRSSTSWDASWADTSAMRSSARHRGEVSRPCAAFTAAAIRPKQAPRMASARPAAPLRIGAGPALPMTAARRTRSPRSPTAARTARGSGSDEDSGRALAVRARAATGGPQPPPGLPDLPRRLSEGSASALNR
jgi:hypothetical protein